MKNFFKVLPGFAVLLAVSCRNTTEEVFRLVENGDGPTLGYSPASGVAILRQDGYFFKDLNRNGKLDPYEDWRLDADTRATDLASVMTIEQIAGLMLFSSRQTVPDYKSEYGGGSYKESGTEPWQLSDQQKILLGQNHLRHLFITSISTPSDAAKWNNSLQTYAEGLEFGIPCSLGTDHRCTLESSAKGVESVDECNRNISVWPDGLALAATFDPALARQAGETASMEYRALGITTALSPQVDLGTEPRWSRIAGTFGEDPVLSADMARAFIDGLQTSAGTAEIKDGWGYASVNSMVKHWPGGGTGESGRDGHYAYGKFGVYPGDNFEMHLIPFTQGAFKLEGPTGSASAVIPYYNIAYNQSPDSLNVGNAYSRYIITDLLRETYGYDGVVCTDWGVTKDEGVTPDVFAGKPWGAEELGEAQRHLMLLMAGVDQFGGNDDPAPLLDAYRMGDEEYGPQYMRERFEQSAVRILRNMFRVGLFENPYTDPDSAYEIADNDRFTEAGYQTQLKSIVMLKNAGEALPVTQRMKVYMPRSFYPAAKGRGGRGKFEERWLDAVDPVLLDRYFESTDDPDQADFAVVLVNSPNTEGRYTGGYDINDRTAGGNGYVPISLQYRPYMADSARVHSMAAGDPVIDSIVTNRSYWEKTVVTNNDKDLDIILATREKMGSKPLIVVVNLTRPMVFSEFEDKADAILANFGVSNEAVLDIISGKAMPSGLLPVQMPANMVTVEMQYEDRPFDMECHTDSQGNVYDFAFGMDWNGVIKDARTAKYRRPTTEDD